MITTTFALASPLQLIPITISLIFAIFVFIIFLRDQNFHEENGLLAIYTAPTLAFIVFISNFIGSNSIFGQMILAPAYILTLYAGSKTLFRSIFYEYGKSHEYFKSAISKTHRGLFVALLLSYTFIGISAITGLRVFTEMVDVIMFVISWLEFYLLASYTFKVYRDKKEELTELNLGDYLYLIFTNMVFMAALTSVMELIDFVIYLFHTNYYIDIIGHYTDYTATFDSIWLGVICLGALVPRLIRHFFFNVNK